MNVRQLAAAALLVIGAGAVVPTAAQAAVVPFRAPAQDGVLERECGRFECSFEYRDPRNGASRVLLRSLTGKRFLLTDSAAVIDVEPFIGTGPGGNHVCRLLSHHSVVCRTGPVEPPCRENCSPACMFERCGEYENDVTIVGGNGGDIIDTRRFTGAAFVYGGTGNDKLFVGVGHDELDGGRRRAVLVPGGGEDLLVGNRFTEVDFSDTTAPFMVNLLKHVLITRGEHARIFGVGIIRGGKGDDRMIGGRTPGTTLVGGDGHNYLVSNRPGTYLRLPEPHETSTFVCGREARIEPERNDLALGGCRLAVTMLQMLLPLRRLSSPVVELPHAYRYREVNLRALPSGRLIGRKSILPPAAPAVAYCYLSRAGRTLLRRLGHLVVRVEAFVPGGPPHENRTLVFKTLLERPHVDLR